MKTVTLHKDYYNNITAEELEGLYSTGRFMGKYELQRYIMLVLAAAVLLMIFCVTEFRRLKKSRYFYFGNGRIIYVKNELIENSRKLPDRYYRNTVTIAVSEEEAVSVY